MAKDKELLDHERAHTGKPGSKVRHGMDAVGRVTERPFTSQSSDSKVSLYGHKDGGLANGLRKMAGGPQARSREDI